MQRKLSIAIKHWRYVAPALAYPSNETEFDALVDELDELLEIVGNDEKHPLMSLVDAMSYVIEAYEAAHYQIKAKGVDALKYLMQAHELSQSDFPEIASQGVMSEILKGKRQLNVRQIKALAKRFHVDPSTFIDD